MSNPELIPVTIGVLPPPDTHEIVRRKAREGETHLWFHMAEWIAAEGPSSGDEYRILAFPKPLFVNHPMSGVTTFSDDSVKQAKRIAFDQPRYANLDGFELAVRADQRRLDDARLTTLTQRWSTERKNLIDGAHGRIEADYCMGKASAFWSAIQDIKELLNNTTNSDEKQ